MQQTQTARLLLHEETATTRPSDGSTGRPHPFVHGLLVGLGMSAVAWLLLVAGAVALLR